VGDGGSAASVTAAEVLEMLERGSFDDLIGVVEDGRVDFKREPYKLNSDLGKFELGKDVAAFANGREDGIVVIGVETETREDSPFERASRARPMSRSLINEKQYRDTIRDRCYPVPEGFTVTAFPAAGDEERCLLAIFVPAQGDQDRPYLVLRPIDANRQKLQGWLVGFPRRSLDETEQARPGELHELIARGRNVAPRLDEIAVMIAQQRPPSAEAEPAPLAETPEGEAEPGAANVNPFGVRQTLRRADGASRRFAAEPDSQGGQVQAPTLTLMARPRETVTVPTLFSGQEGGVRTKLEQPPVTRNDGWNLTTLERAEIVNGDHLRLESGHRKLVEFYEDGTFVVVARFDELLTRGRKQMKTPQGEDVSMLKVNSLAVIEFVHDFVLTFAELLPFMEPSPRRAIFGVSIGAARTWPGGQLFLPPYGLGTMGWEMPMSATAPDEDTFTWRTVESISDLDVGRIAFQLVQRIYAYFKRTVEEIPYLTEDREAVDPASFARQP
jgi:hypothetical protein